MPPTIREGEEMATGGKEEEDLPPEEKYLPHGMEAPLDASTVERKDTMHTTALGRNSNPTIRGTINKPTSLI